MGHAVEEHDLPECSATIWPTYTRMMSVHTARGFEARMLMVGTPVTEADVEPVTWAVIQRGRSVTGVQHCADNLGHFQLTLALLPALRAARGARVVNVSSGAQRFGRIRWDDPHFTAGYDSRAAYAQSKTANVLFAFELDRRWAADSIRGYAVHPGVVVGTKLNSSAGDEALRRMGLIDEVGQPIIDPKIGEKTPQQGASTVVFAATGPLLAGIGGVYLRDSDISPLDHAPRQLTAECIPAEVASHSIDPQSAERLWKLSEWLLEPAHS